MEIPVKAWWKSKTVWFNVVLFLAEVVIQLLPELEARFSGGSTIWLLGVGAAANVFLRLFATTQPVTVTAALRRQIQDQTVQIGGDTDMEWYAVNVRPYQRKLLSDGAGSPVPLQRNPE